MQVFEQKLQEEIVARSTQIINGRVTTFPKYTEMAGEIRGLNIAGEILTDTIQKARQEQDDDE